MPPQADFSGRPSTSGSCHVPVPRPNAVPARRSLRIPVTVSVAVAVAVSHRDTAGPDELIGEADAKLYDAKRGGRNRVVS